MAKSDTVFVATADIQIQSRPFKRGSVVGRRKGGTIEPVDGVNVGHVKARLMTGLVEERPESEAKADKPPAQPTATANPSRHANVQTTGPTGAPKHTAGAGGR